MDASGPGGGHTDSEQAASTVSSVRERLRGWVSQERVAMHFEGRAILIDGEIVTDLDRPAPPAARIVIAAR